jgi:sugar/nucleoside kinase (ribokinase family)
MLSAAGVDARHVLETPGVATAINTALVSVSGERSFFVFPGACRQIAPTDLPDDVLRGFNHLHLAAIGSLPGRTGTAGADVARRARALGLTVSLDTTLNPPRDPRVDVLPLLPHVDLFLPNLDEARAVLGTAGLDREPVNELLQRGLGYGLRIMGIKQGEAGCALATADERVHVPAFPVPVVDTCGSGDAWSTAVAFGWLQGWPLGETGRFANAAGALCALEVGATAGLADQATIRRFLAERAEEVGRRK